MTNERNRSTKKRGCLGCAGRGIGIGLLLLLAVGAVGCIYQSRGTAADLETYQPTGEIVDVNGRNMHIDCRGSGSPTIVLDAGTGGWSTGWSEIAPQLEATNRVCTYDRAGYGWSDAADDARLPQEIAADMMALLEAADEPAPYLLVGFSYTGLSARVAAVENPDSVKGLVLIDPTTEFDNEISSEELLAQQQQGVGTFRVFSTLSKIGVIRFLDPASMAGSAPMIPTDALEPELYYTFLSHPQWWETFVKEFEARLSDDTLAYIRDNAQIPNIPTAIIGAEFVDEGNSNPDLQEKHTAVLQQMAADAPNATYIFAEGSTHEVPRDDPALVVQTIIEIAGQVGSGR